MVVVFVATKKHNLFLCPSFPSKETAYFFAVIFTFVATKKACACLPSGLGIIYYLKTTCWSHLPEEKMMVSKNLLMKFHHGSTKTPIPGSPKSTIKRIGNFTKERLFLEVGNSNHPKNWGCYICHEPPKP